MAYATTALASLEVLADKGPDVAMRRRMVDFMDQHLMDTDVETLRGAGYDEKSAERLNRVIVFFLQIDTPTRKNSNSYKHLQSRLSRTSRTFGAN